MSKKKATMTLKDFHGGSIPSDLPLPSAPGVCHGGNSAGRPEHRLRQHLLAQLGPLMKIPISKPSSEQLLMKAFLSAGSPGGSYAGRVLLVAMLGNRWLDHIQMPGGIRKEASSMKEPAAAAWSAPEAETKLAHASALEKISSGRWSSNQQMNPQKDAAVFGHPETEGNYQDVGLVVHAERSLTFHGGGREVPQAYDRAKSAVRVDSYEKSTPATANVQRYEQTSDNLHMEDNLEVKNSIVGDRAPERPKLNLKPRFQSHEQLEGNKEVKGSEGTVFGEARPRELVLKARGVEDDLINYEGQPALRVKEVSPKSEGIPTNQRMAKYSNRRENQLDVERSDSQRRNNKQSEIWRNNKDAEKNRNQQPKQPQDRAPSPETWRKPIEHGKPAPTDAPMRFGKAASAVELAQAFSKSVSDPTAADRASGPRGIPGRNQMPFSRLTGPTPRPQINGY
ncbi:hypothetical protein SASPL_146505 [Salvia splendens]|uniref:Uncharacterized protein n=1 Tax=Salvia splendens TaxID=180675 RepID=A0A8X8Z591_SALSN|nr:hypothetical protein SASPL_146505 [Salvia splendens]